MHVLKSGDWITQERIRVYSWILVVLWIAGISALVITATPELLDFKGRPLGTDFANVWSAGTLALEGQGALAYDWSAHHAVQQRMFSNPEVPYFGWHYPPFFLMVASVLALMPYMVALAVWIAATFPLYLGALRSIAPFPLTTLVAAAFPAVAVNVIHGQNGFLTAGLFGAALLQLDRRPLLSGVCFGLLAYKPQYGVLIPLVLAATGRWRTFGAAAVMVAGLVGISTALFGMDVWQAFLDSTRLTREVVLEAGALAWHKQQSAFGALSLLGADKAVAYAGQGLVALVVVMATLWLWRAPVDLGLKSAGLVTGAILITPYVLDYDLVILALAIAWMVAHGMRYGFHTWEKTILVLVWAVPLVSRISSYTLKVPMGLMAMLMLFVLIIARARHDARQVITGS